MNFSKKLFTFRREGIMIREGMEDPFGKAMKRRVGCETPPERAARETGAVSGLSAKHLKTVSERPLIGHGGPVTG